MKSGGYTLYAEEIIRPLDGKGASNLIGHTIYKAPPLSTAAFNTTSVVTQPERQGPVLCEYYKQRPAVCQELKWHRFCQRRHSEERKRILKRQALCLPKGYICMMRGISLQTMKSQKRAGLLRKLQEEMRCILYPRQLSNRTGI